MLKVTLRTLELYQFLSYLDFCKALPRDSNLWQLTSIRWIKQLHFKRALAGNALENHANWELLTAATEPFPHTVSKSSFRHKQTKANHSHRTGWSVRNKQTAAGPRGKCCFPASSCCLVVFECFYCRRNIEPSQMGYVNLCYCVWFFIRLSIALWLRPFFVTA